MNKQFELLTYLLVSSVYEQQKSPKGVSLVTTPWPYDCHPGRYWFLDTEISPLLTG